MWLWNLFMWLHSWMHWLMLTSNFRETRISMSKELRKKLWQAVWHMLCVAYSIWRSILCLRSARLVCLQYNMRQIRNAWESRSAEVWKSTMQQYTNCKGGVETARALWLCGVGKLPRQQDYGLWKSCGSRRRLLCFTPYSHASSSKASC